MSYNIAEGQNEVLDDVSFGAFGESGLQADPPSFSLASLNLTGSAFQFSLWFLHVARMVTAFG